MRRAGRFPALVLGAALLSGCSGDGVTGVGDRDRESLPGGQASPVRVGSMIDVSGDWNWSNVEVLSFPPFVAAEVGVEPEGPEGHNTHARCESAGTMTLIQTGYTFEGSATKTFNACVTRGGQPFQQPGVFFLITDGRITGAAVAFSLRSLTVQPCPHHAVITAVDEGVATALSGTGRCILPDHPQSESPFRLPPSTDKGGLSKTLSFEAARP